MSIHTKSREEQNAFLKAATLEQAHQAGFCTWEWECSTPEKTKAYQNRNYVANMQVMYTECYTEFDEPDAFEMLERVELDDSNMPLDNSFSETLELSDYSGFYDGEC